MSLFFQDGQGVIIATIAHQLAVHCPLRLLRCFIGLLSVNGPLTVELPMLIITEETTEILTTLAAIMVKLMATSRADLAPALLVIITLTPTAPDF